MDFDFTTLPERDRYRLLCGFVGPRPIALVSTVSRAGQPNAAPMSFFNVLSHDPPILGIGVQRRRDGARKDTEVNILDAGEFVVNMVEREFASETVACGVDHPSDVDEVEVSGLTWEPSVAVRPARVHESPCSMECRLERAIDVGGRLIILGLVVHMGVDEARLDPDRPDVREGTYAPLARLHADNYIEARDQFVVRAPTPTASSEGKTR